ILRGIHGAPRVPTGRRAALPRLEDLGARRSAVREAVRGGNESAGDAARGCQPVDGLARRARPAHEARLRRSAGGGPGADSAPAARRYGIDHVRRGRAPGDPCPGQDGPVDPPGARAARYAGRPWDSRGGGAAASHRLAGAPRSRGPRIRPAVRSGPRPHRAPLPAPSRPQRDRVPPDGSGGGRAVRSSRGAVSGSGVSGERGRAAARAGSRLWRDGASGGGGVAQRVPPPRNRVSPCTDRPAVRHGAPPPRVSFLHPLALVGLAAAAIPALLHLLERRIPPEVEFPPLRYLSEAERQSARRLRLRHVLLLLLRTGLIVLIVLAAARPLVPAPAAAPLRSAAGHQRTALVVILDNSVSSGAVADGRPVLDRLRAAARGSLAAAAASDRVWLVLADGVARAGTREALLATVDSAGVSPRRLDLTAAVRDAARLVNAEPLEGREVHVMSDLQRTALGPGHAAVARGVRVLALAPGSEVPANRGVGGARVSDGAVAVSIVGTPGARPAAVTLRVGGREVGRGLAAPGTTLTMSLPLGGPGWWVGEVALDADELRADDRRVFAWRVAPPGQV